MVKYSVHEKAAKLPAQFLASLIRLVVFAVPGVFGDVVSEYEFV